MGIIIKKSFLFLVKILVILLCTPENFFKDFFDYILINSKFIHTVKAAAAFNTLCFPNNFNFIFLIFLFFFLISLKLKSKIE